MPDPPATDERSTPAAAQAAGAPGPFAIGTWQVAPGWYERLQSGGSLDWFALGGDPRATAVKTNPNRRVWRLRRGQAVLYVKAFSAAGWADRLRGLLRGPEALREWRVGGYAEAAGVPCVRFVACGTRRRGWIAKDSAVITEAADGVVPLPEAWREAVRLDADTGREQASRALTDAVARLLADAHAARFLHRDGHPRNILVRGVGQSSPEALYVDLYGAATGMPLSDQRAADGLAQLDQWFCRHASRAARLRFLKRYLADRFGDGRLSPAMVRRWASVVDRARRRQAARLYAQRDRRIRRRGKYFATLPLDGGWRATVTLRFRNRQEFPQPVHPDRTADQAREWLQGVLSGIEPGKRCPEDVGVDRFVADNLARQVAWTVNGGPAARAFAVGHGLRHRNIPCLWPLAALERRVELLVRESVLITELRPGTVVLGDLLEGTCPQADRWHDAPCRQAILLALGRLLADISMSGMVWSAPEPSQVWIDWTRPAGQPGVLIGRSDGVSFDHRAAAERGQESIAALIRNLELRAGFEPADATVVRQAFEHRFGRVGGRTRHQPG